MEGHHYNLPKKKKTHPVSHPMTMVYGSSPPLFTEGGDQCQIQLGGGFVNPTYALPWRTLKAVRPIPCKFP